MGSICSRKKVDIEPIKSRRVITKRIYNSPVLKTTTIEQKKITHGTNHS